MTTEDLSPQEAARWALRAGLPVEPGRLDVIAATANHIQHVLRPLRELDLLDAAPAVAQPPLGRTTALTSGEEQADALAV
ncbi:hypothetical protein [Streptomyces sp. N2A]|uniref:hypothetical protein n=1 Tax=Streptomyces sp. N2A TaxID=3073936 RepID=UPI00287037E7|nr:hypothetical protein [Streptomyces sp. N2A]